MTKPIVMVQCLECGEIMPWSRADASCKRTLRETRDQPEEWILVCPECGAEQPRYDVVEDPTAAAIRGRVTMTQAREKLTAHDDAAPAEARASGPH